MFHKLDFQKINEIVRAEGLNASLPFAILDKNGQLLFASKRMEHILKSEGQLKYPVSLKELEEIWLFHNDDMAGPAILKNLLLGRDEKQAIIAQAEQKSYKLYSHYSNKHKVYILMGELIRRGDLLQDKESRQLLFRVISHEIRTSTQVMKGYLQMINIQDDLISDRMWGSLERLDKVIEMLDDLKVELETDLKKTKKVS